MITLCGKYTICPYGVIVLVNTARSRQTIKSKCYKEILKWKVGITHDKKAMTPRYISE